MYEKELEERRQQLETWTREELIEAVMTLEDQAGGKATTHRAVVYMRQGPHRAIFSVSFGNGELFDLVLREVQERSIDRDEKRGKAIAIAEYVRHYLLDARHECTTAIGQQFAGGLSPF